jgi:hypothetical protein
MSKYHLSKRLGAFAGAGLLTVGVGAASLGLSAGAGASVKQFSFHMVRSTGAVKANCLSGAQAAVSIRSQGPVETMKVKASGLPANTDFDLFVIQDPNAPFGIGWYQGDLDTNAYGQASGTFIGRFSVETFAVAPGTAPAPTTFNGPFPDASANPPFNPVQMYHLGLWFNSPTDAGAAGCGSAVTPFNGEHDAGVQALSTRDFPLNAGPLRNIHT